MQVDATKHFAFIFPSLVEGVRGWGAVGQEGCHLQAGKLLEAQTQEEKPGGSPQEGGLLGQAKGQEGRHQERCHGVGLGQVKKKIHELQRCV